MQEGLDVRTEELLCLLKSHMEEVLADNLVGVYLHGSLALKSFNPKVSDVDYIIVVREALTIAVKEKIMENAINELLPLAPPKGLEFHVMLLKDTQNFVYPPTFDFHFSNMYLQRYMSNPREYIRSMQGGDEDLAAHIMVINQRGHVLTGAPISEVFAEVPQKYYWESILYDIQDAKNQICETPMYTILNLCRTLAYKQTKKVLSKKEGGEWGLKELPEEFHSLTEHALQEYETDTFGVSKGCYEKIASQRFAAYMLREIEGR